MVWDDLDDSSGNETPSLLPLDSMHKGGSSISVKTAIPAEIDAQGAIEIPEQD